MWKLTRVGWLAVGFNASLHETRKLRKNGEPCSSYAKVQDLLVRLFYLSPSQSNPIHSQQSSKARPLIKNTKQCISFLLQPY
jgi:hypothetical protein